jgi:hypothetical protein
LTKGGQQQPKAYFHTDETRRKTSVHNTSTHFMMGKHSTVHFSQTKLSTALRDGLLTQQSKQIGSCQNS